MGGLLRILLLLGFVVKFWSLILLVLAVAAAGCWQLERQRREQRALIARADEQHAWVLAGDDRGVYGLYPPQ
jgi:hypothetical protein